MSRLEHNPTVEVVIALAGLYLAQCLHVDYITEKLQLEKTPTCMTMWILSSEGFLTSALACMQTLFLVRSLPWLVALE